jgi:hypothetical protein
MGIQTFFKQRRPRQFEHKLIYWDPRKEELEKRVERIRQEMIAAGELDPQAPTSEVPTDGDQTAPLSPSTYDSSEQIRGAFIHSARHLSRQHKRGITSSDRDQRIIKLMLALMVLGLFFWYFFLR